MLTNKAELSEDEYEQALERIECLMDSPLNNPERDELVTLVAAVEKYEDIHWPISEPQNGVKT